jgi:hypothetical protein
MVAGLLQYKENYMPKTDERMRPFALRIPEKLFLDI